MDKQRKRWKPPVPGLVLFAGVMVAAIFAAAIGINVAFERSLRADPPVPAARAKPAAESASAPAGRISPVS